MDKRMLTALQKTAGAVDTSVNGYFDYLLKEADDNEVITSTASSNTTASSSSSPGMEEKNLNYGKGTTDNTEPSGGTRTGQVEESHAGQNITSEASGIPDISLSKSAVLKHNLNVSGIATRLRHLGLGV